MKSNLFKKLALLPGLNWFNRKEKIEYQPGKLTESLEMPRPKMTWHDLRRQNERYFSHMVAQDQFVMAMLPLIEQFDGAVAHWDKIQAGHEDEVERLKGIIRKRDNEIAALQKAKPVKQIQNVTISDQSVDRLIAHLERIALLTQGKYSREKEVKRAREMHNTLHNFLQKLRANAGEE